MGNFLYLIPSIFTAGNMFCGFFSIIMTIKNNFELAGWVIIVAILFDGLDGSVARLAKKQDFFGTEFDSLADMVSFCVAPMVLLYKQVLNNYNMPGIVIAFIYVLFGSIRLVRYNVFVIKEQLNKNLFFEGLPTTAAAGAIVSISLLLSALGLDYVRKNIVFVVVPIVLKFLPGIIIIISLLMITKLRYLSFSRLRFNKKVTLKMFTIIISSVLLIFAYPESTIFLVFGIYVISGLVDYLVRMYKIKLIKAVTKQS